MLRPRRATSSARASSSRSSPRCSTCSRGAGRADPARGARSRRARSRSRSTRRPLRSTAHSSAPGRRSTRNLPERSQQATRSLGDERLSGLVQRYVEAWESRDVDFDGGARRGRELRDAAVPALVQRARHRDRVHGRHREAATAVRAHARGGQPAVGWYMRRAPREVYLPTSIEVLALEGERVSEVIAFASPSLFPTSACRRSCRPRIESSAR